MDETANHHAPPQSARAPLAPAPEPDGPPPEARPGSYSAEFLIETAEGFVVKFTGVGLTPADVLVWLEKTSKGLAARGFKPVRPDATVNVSVAGGGGQAAASPAAVGAGGAGEASAIAPTAIGEPPQCSLHGDMKHVKGVYPATYKSGPNQGQPNPRAGETYAFWGCTNSRCKTTWRAA